MEKCVSLKIYGLVQGVSYRIASRKKARELEISGWVKNEKDGTVSVFAQGEKEKLNRFVAWCYDGSTSAKVKRVEVTFCDCKEKLNDFEIKYND